MKVDAIQPGIIGWDSVSQKFVIDTYAGPSVVVAGALNELLKL